jgi:acetolactate decarboxylase
LFRPLLLLLVTASLALGLGARPARGPAPDTLFQTSTINALLAGIYDGPMTVGELQRHGDFGIGTFNALDGEMVAVDGVFYQVKSDGVARRVNGRVGTPFAVVKFFRADRRLTLGERVDYAGIERFLDETLGFPNHFHAVRIEGRFDYVQTRSVPEQRPPYLPLAQVVQHQTLAEHRNVEGVLVGFRTPDYMETLNVPGYHFHFLTKDRRAGGHLLACDAAAGLRVEIDRTDQFHLALPNDRAFSEASLGGPKRDELEQVERLRRE